jgi:putative transcriptional regulator
MVSRLLAAVLWLALSASPAFADEAKPMRAIFLVARPDMPDPNFGDSVVLVTQRAGSMPLGVILNKPTPVTLASLFADIEQLKGSEERVFNGGPVRPGSLSVIFRAATAPKDAVEILDGVYLSSDVEQLRELLTAGKARSIRVYAGYSGWGPGQLENEIARGDWRLTPADAKSIFETRPQELWPVMRRRTAPKTIALH